MVFLRGLEADTLHCLYIGRDDPSCGAGELMLEGRTDRTIEIFHLFVTLKAFTIRRIQHYQSPFRMYLFDLLHSDLLEFDILGYTC